MGSEGAQEKTASAPATDQTSASTDELKRKLSEHIEAARLRLEELKQSFLELKDQDSAAMDQKAEDLRQRVEAQKERLGELRGALESWSREKRDQTRETIASWRQRRELAHLERRAERAEEEAVNTVLIALLDADEAEEAMFEAIRARIDVEGVRAGLAAEATAAAAAG
jgi:hypothetical protein